MKKIGKRSVIALVSILLFTNSFSQLSYASSNDAFTEADMTTTQWNNWSNNWDSTIKSDLSKVALSPGSDESQLNFAWNTKKELNVKSIVKIVKKTDMQGNEFPKETKEFIGTSTDGYSGYKTNRVTVTGLEQNTVYIYSYWNGSKWTTPEEYKTQNPDKASILFITDPQLGASLGNISSKDKNELGQDRAAKNDGYVWNQLLNNAVAKNPNVSFIISAGDQVNSTSTGDGSEHEYAALLEAAQMKKLPMAPTIGNHDTGNKSYSYHFNVPNNTGKGTTNAGGDYYYSYGNTLFVVFNSNSDSMDQHEAVIKEAIQKNPDYKWLVGTMHHDIYGVGQWHSQGDSKAKREKFAQLLEKYNFDVVLSGHDHAYSRSYQISDTKSSDSYTVTKPTLKDGIVQDPKGILYITGNCCTGSKYYTITPDLNKLSYVAKSWQGNDPSYSILNITDSSFSISTYDANKGNLIDDSYTIVKTKNIVVAADKSQLEKIVKESESVLENAVEGEKDGQFKIGSIKKLNEVLKPAKELLAADNANQQDIDGTVKTLNDNLAEFNKMKIVIDRSLLEEQMTNAKEILSDAKEGTKKGEYKIGSKSTFEEQINEALDVYNKKEVTKNEIDNAVDNLESKIKEFKTNMLLEDEIIVDEPVVIDRGSLEEQIANAKEILSDAKEGTKKGEYKIGSKDIFEAQINEALDVYNKKEVTETEIDNAIDTLESKVKEFKNNMLLEDEIIIDEPVVIDRSSLEEQITNAKEILSDAKEGTKKGEYKIGSKSTFEEQINEASNVLNKKEVTKNEIDNACSVLESKVKEFKTNMLLEDEIIVDEPVVIDRSSLEEQIKNAKEILSDAKEGTKKGEYKIGSKSIFEEQINEASNVLNKKEVTKNEIDNACSALESKVKEFKYNQLLEDDNTVVDNNTKVEDKNTSNAPSTFDSSQMLYILLTMVMISSINLVAFRRNRV